MLRNKLCILCALLLLGAVQVGAAAAEVSCDSVYCFGAEDFGQELAGICLRELPAASQGRVLLKDRVLRPGDVLTVDQIGQMTFVPVWTETDGAVQVGYLPIGKDGVGKPAAMSLGLRGKENKPPIAEDSALETYKNLPNSGKLRASDPEGQSLSFTLTRQPRRGSVTIGEDGSFTYTPQKNKVGVDSGVYTATDPAGKVSREATVTITILKPGDGRTYEDTAGSSCRFTAEWMKNTGIFTGESLAGKTCFGPEKTVSRGEFLTMLVKTLDLPTQEASVSDLEQLPLWLRPYAAAALRAGLTAQTDWQAGFEPDAVVTGGEAAALVCGALELEPGDAGAVQTLAAEGICLTDQSPLTREQAANTLYRLDEILNTRK